MRVGGGSDVEPEVEDVAVGFRLLSPLGERLGEGVMQEIVFDPLP